MLKAQLGARILLGLVFFVFGLNGFLYFTIGKGFIPMPPPPPDMVEIMNGFLKTIYLMPLVKLLETICGLLLLIGKKERLALTLLAPIVVNIMGIHLFVERSGLPMAIAISGLTGFLIAKHWKDGFDRLIV